MKKEKIIDLFKKNKGWLRSKDFNYKTEAYEIINKMIQSQEIEVVKKGIFRHFEYNSLSEFEDISNYYPDSVICMFSAWHFYNLSTSIPYQVHLAFKHKKKPTNVKYPPMKFYFWSENQYNLGIIDSNQFKIYDIEKSVCDAVKFRNKIGEEITYEVLKNYMLMKERNIDKLMKYAESMKIKKIITPMLKALL